MEYAKLNDGIFPPSSGRRAFVAGAGALVGIGALALSGCAESRSQQSEKPTDDSTSDAQATSNSTDESAGATPTASGKSLVVFYSRANENYPSEWLEVGHTKVMAGYIADAIGADTYEIVPTEPYPESYDECCDVALEEQRADARPSIANTLPDVSAYDLVFIGCPIWWGDEPMVVRTFVEGVDLAGKTIVPFTTHAGSGLGNVPANLKAALTDARFLDGLAIAGTDVDNARDRVTTWAKGLA